MTVIDAIILGVVEGLTEFLPVSSTGHLILTQTLLGLDAPAQKAAVDAYLIIIQFGAILAVLALYKQRALEMLQGLLGKNPAGRALFLKLIVAFFPAAVVGKLFDDLIEGYLFYAVPVASALIVGGVVMLFVEKFITRPREEGRVGKPLKEIEDLSFQDAFLIGVMQCAALWPGTSRSMSTIVGGQLVGLRSKSAAEFSFLLALPTLGAATAYKALKQRHELMAMDGGLLLIAVGNVVALIVAVLAVKWFVGVVTRFGMAPFAYYRIVLGVLFLVLALAGFVRISPEAEPAESPSSGQQTASVVH